MKRFSSKCRIISDPVLILNLLLIEMCIYVREIKLSMHIYNSNGKWPRIALILFTCLHKT